MLNSSATAVGRRPLFIHTESNLVPLLVLAQTCDRKACAAVCRGVRTKECAPAEPPPAVPPPSASAGSPPHGHGHAQPRRHRRHRHRRRRCPPLPAPRLHLQPPPSCRAASSCGLHVDAASADTRAAVALSLGCHLCMLLVVPCRSKACCVQLHCRAGGLQLHCRALGSCTGMHGCMAFAFGCGKLGPRGKRSNLEIVILQWFSLFP